MEPGSPVSDVLLQACSPLILVNYTLPKKVSKYHVRLSRLTLIRAAGGVYDFRNFEQV